MALRTKQTVNIAIAGSAIAHGCVNSNPAAGQTNTPNEIKVLPTIAAGAGQTYRYAASDATYVYLAQGTTATSADVVCSINHSFVS